MKKRKSLVIALTCVVAWPASGTAAAGRTVEVEVRPDAVAVRPLVDCALVSIAVSDPRGDVASKHFKHGVAPVLELGPASDGVYTYEVRLVPSDRSEPRVESGYFRLQGGTVVGPEDAGRPVRPRQDEGAVGRPPQPTDTPINDDLIVQGRVCAGLDCALNEPFVLEALRLKGVLPGIKFVDTFTGPGAHDWDILINNPVSGASQFGVFDIDALTVPFALRGNAPTNSLYVNEFGNVGVGTSTPAGALHIARSVTPSLVLEQTGGPFYEPAAWDMNVSNVGRLVVHDRASNTNPLQIAPSPLGSLSVGSTGNVGAGMGILPPASALHVRRSNGSAKLLVEEGSTTVMARTLFEIRNTGPANIRLTNTSGGNFWGLGHNGLSNFYITNQLTPFPSLALELQPDGDLTILGTVTQSSDRNTKDDLAPVDPQAILAGVAQLSIGTWRRKTDEPGVRHLGPMAQDFAAAFGLGDDERRISPLDVSGVALVAVQALDAQAKALGRQNAELAHRIATLRAAREQR